MRVGWRKANRADKSLTSLSGDATIPILARAPAAGSRLPRIRRISQILFFALFVVLLWNTALPGSLRGSQADIRIPYPIRLFLENKIEVYWGRVHFKPRSR